MLAAETHQWDIFLRAHLNIMNDRFERVTDGSYAWAGRGTYLKELEELNINTVDLLIGTCLEAKNINDNHYQSRVNRTARALAESSQKTEVETRLLEMIQDDQLDLYNRMIMAYLYIFYSQYLNEPNHYLANKAKFKQAIRSFPGDMYKRFDSVLAD
jgi:hypothetical protein